MPRRSSHNQGQQELCASTLARLPEIYFTKLEKAACLFQGEASLDAARRQLALSSDQTVEMLWIIRDRLRESGQVEEAERYARIAQGIIEVFHHEEGEAFQHDCYAYLREMAQKL